MSFRTRRRWGFTLIELLTVITIIAILVALLFPAVKASITKAETARARTMVQHIGAAFRSYFAEYSIWPTNSGETVSFDLTTNLFRNTASITFLDVSAKDVGFYSGSATNRILDPWRKPYHAIVDGLNYVGYVQNPFSGGGTISSGYAIWSDGPDGTNDYSAAQDVGVNKDNIRSW
jgi:prepilin-type N-terminal cleavage/methylation domain-containing protein